MILASSITTAISASAKQTGSPFFGSKSLLTSSLNDAKIAPVATPEKTPNPSATVPISLHRTPLSVETTERAPHKKKGQVEKQQSPTTDQMFTLASTAIEEGGGCVYRAGENSANGRKTTNLYSQKENVVFRHEWIENSSQGKSLIIQDVLLNPQTATLVELQQQRISTTTMANTKQGATVLAFRDGDVIHLVLATPLGGQISTSNGTFSSQCGHLRTTIKADEIATAMTGSIWIQAAPPKTQAGLRGDHFEEPQPRQQQPISISVSKVKRDPAPWLSVVLPMLEDSVQPPTVREFGMVDD